MKPVVIVDILSDRVLCHGFVHSGVLWTSGHAVLNYPSDRHVLRCSTSSASLREFRAIAMVPALDAVCLTRDILPRELCEPATYWTELDRGSSVRAWIQGNDAPIACSVHSVIVARSHRFAWQSRLEVVLRDAVCIVLDHRFEQGASGAPVFDAHERFIGLVHGNSPQMGDRGVILCGAKSWRVERHDAE